MLEVLNHPQNLLPELDGSCPARSIAPCPVHRRDARFAPFLSKLLFPGAHVGSRTGPGTAAAPPHHEGDLGGHSIPPGASTRLPPLIHTTSPRSLPCEPRLSTAERKARHCCWAAAQPACSSAGPAPHAERSPALAHGHVPCPEPERFQGSCLHRSLLPQQSPSSVPFEVLLQSLSLRFISL